MSHTIELTDEQYQAVLRAARAWGKSVEVYLAEIAEEASRPYYTMVDNFARALGTSEEVIEESKRLFREREGKDADVWLRYLIHQRISAPVPAAAGALS